MNLLFIEIFSEGGKLRIGTQAVVCTLFNA